MTLIFGYQDTSYALIASDTRLTLPDGTLVDSDTVKTILWNDRLILAYTGLAIIDGTDTGEWIAVTIKDFLTMPEMLELLADELTKQDLPRQAANPRLIVGGNGWAINPEDGRLEPIAVSVWNEDDDGKVVRTFRHTFSFFDPPFFAQMGSKLSTRRTRDLKRTIRRALESGISIWTIAKIFERTIRSKSLGDEQREPDPYVGPDVLITALSRQSVAKGLASGQHSVRSGGNLDDHAISIYVPQTANGVQWRAPAIVNKGMVLTDIMGGPNLPGGPTPEQRERAEREYRERQERADEQPQS